MLGSCFVHKLKFPVLLSKLLFISEIEKKEAEKEAPNGTGEGPSEEKTDANKTEDGSTKKNKKKEKKKKKKKNMSKQMEETEENANVSDVKNPSGEGDSLEEVDFWIPPSGDRWDFDDGGQRYGSDSGPETDDSSGTGTDPQSYKKFHVTIFFLSLMKFIYSRYEKVRNS